MFAQCVCVCVCSFLAGGSEKLLRVCLNLPYFLRYINRFQDAVSANSFFIMPATVADATAVRNGWVRLKVIAENLASRAIYKQS